MTTGTSKLYRTNPPRRQISTLAPWTCIPLAEGYGMGHDSQGKPLKHLCTLEVHHPSCLPCQRQGWGVQKRAFHSAPNSSSLLPSNPSGLGGSCSSGTEGPSASPASQHPLLAWSVQGRPPLWPPLAGRQGAFARSY
jgi:hypothetical protein